MNFPAFLEKLFAEGRVAVSQPGELARDEIHAAEQVLEAQDQLVRLELPENVPQYDRIAAMGAATQFYQACQFAMFRNVDEQAIAAIGTNSLENWERAQAHYSVDLTFRFLPDLVRITQAAAAEDPLVVLLMNWCRRWPLSSVGVKDVGEVALGPIGDSPGLMQMYVDRVLAREDIERLANKAVQRAVRQTLGLYSALAPKFAEVASSEIEVD